LLKKALYEANKESVRDYPTLLAQTQQQCILQDKTLRALRKEQEALTSVIASAEEEKIALFALWYPTTFTQKTYVHLAQLPLDNPEIQQALREARISPSKPYPCLLYNNIIPCFISYSL
jgi:hypothetical protein